MNFTRLWDRVVGHYRRGLCETFARRDLLMSNRVPLISFSFDDFPSSALQVGGSILRDHGYAGTYYASFGLMNRDSPVGRIFSGADLEELFAQGHELGCHTFAHSHAWKTRPSEFEESILENRRALNRILPEALFKTLSYPISGPRPQTKRRMGRLFACCRGGGQTFNTGTLDRNNVSAFFLERRTGQPDQIKQLIDRNREAGGWLIFATHDVCDQPTKFGCTPAFFEAVVCLAAESGARILPVAQALGEVYERPDECLVAPSPQPPVAPSRHGSH